MDKHQRYRQRKIVQGKCPHCGNPCAPYYECEERRINKKMSRLLNRMVLAGLISKSENPGKPTLYSKEPHEPQIKIKVLEYEIKPGDRRNLPRIGKKFVDIEDICTKILREEGAPLAIEEIEKRFFEKIVEIKKTKEA